MIYDFHKPLILTTPHEKSKRVTYAQKLLHGTNHFHQNFHPGAIDGEMGQQTAGAIHRAKWFLGYPRRGADRSMGETLHKYLTGTKELPAFYKWRRKVRMKVAHRIIASKVKAVEMAITDVGTKEFPANSNKQKYGVWYGANGVYWCAEAISYWLAHAGNKNWYPGFSASCEEIELAARAGSHHLAITSSPEKGDLMIYNHDEHIEFFVAEIEPGVSFKAVGGNTSSGNGSYNNGGEVAINTRYYKGNFPVTAMIRVGL